MEGRERDYLGEGVTSTLQSEILTSTSPPSRPDHPGYAGTTDRVPKPMMTGPPALVTKDLSRMINDIIIGGEDASNINATEGAPQPSHDVYGTGRVVSYFANSDNGDKGSTPFPGWEGIVHRDRASDSSFLDPSFGTTVDDHTKSYVATRSPSLVRQPVSSSTAIIATTTPMVDDYFGMNDICGAMDMGPDKLKGQFKSPSHNTTAYPFRQEYAQPTSLPSNYPLPTTSVKLEHFDHPDLLNRSFDDPNTIFHQRFRGNGQPVSPIMGGVGSPPSVSYLPSIPTNYQHQQQHHHVDNNYAHDIGLDFHPTVGSSSSYTNPRSVGEYEPSSSSSHFVQISKVDDDDENSTGSSLEPLHRDRSNTWPLPRPTLTFGSDPVTPDDANGEHQNVVDSDHRGYYYPGDSRQFYGGGLAPSFSPANTTMIMNGSGNRMAGPNLGRHHVIKEEEEEAETETAPQVCGQEWADSYDESFGLSLLQQPGRLRQHGRDHMMVTPDRTSPRSLYHEDAGNGSSVLMPLPELSPEDILLDEQQPYQGPNTTGYDHLYRLPYPTESSYMSVMDRIPDIRTNVIVSGGGRPMEISASNPNSSTFTLASLNAAAGTTSSAARKNAWGNFSYADLITRAIQTSPEKRLTLSQIYDWMVQHIPYFKDKGDSNSSAGWKNSIRHNLSLHNRFIRLQNEGAGKSSWWMINPDARPGKTARRRASTLDSKAYEKKRGRIRKRISTAATTTTPTPSGISGYSATNSFDHPISYASFVANGTRVVPFKFFSQPTPDNDATSGSTPVANATAAANANQDGVGGYMENGTFFGHRSGIAAANGHSQLQQHQLDAATALAGTKDYNGLVNLAHGVPPYQTNAHYPGTVGNVNNHPSAANYPSVLFKATNSNINQLPFNHHHSTTSNSSPLTFSSSRTSLSPPSGSGSKEILHNNRSPSSRPTGDYTDQEFGASYSRLHNYLAVPMEYSQVPFRDRTISCAAALTGNSYKKKDVVSDPYRSLQYKALYNSAYGNVSEEGSGDSLTKMYTPSAVPPVDEYGFQGRASHLYSRSTPALNNSNSNLSHQGQPCYYETTHDPEDSETTAMDWSSRMPPYFNTNDSDRDRSFMPSCGGYSPEPWSGDSSRFPGMNEPNGGYAYDSMSSRSHHEPDILGSEYQEQRQPSTQDFSQPPTYERSHKDDMRHYYDGNHPRYGDDLAAPAPRIYLDLSESKNDRTSSKVVVPYGDNEHNHAYHNTDYNYGRVNDSGDDMVSHVDSMLGSNSVSSTRRLNSNTPPPLPSTEGSLMNYEYSLLRQTLNKPFSHVTNRMLSTNRDNESISHMYGKRGALPINTQGPDDLEDIRVDPLLWNSTQGEGMSVQETGLVPNYKSNNGARNHAISPSLSVAQLSGNFDSTKPYSPCREQSSHHESSSHGFPFMAHRSVSSNPLLRTDFNYSDSSSSYC